MQVRGERENYIDDHHTNLTWKTLNTRLRSALMIAPLPVGMLTGQAQWSGERSQVPYMTDLDFSLHMPVCPFTLNTTFISYCLCGVIGYTPWRRNQDTGVECFQLSRGFLPWEIHGYSPHNTWTGNVALICHVTVNMKGFVLEIHFQFLVIIGRMGNGTNKEAPDEMGPQVSLLSFSSFSSLILKAGQDWADAGVGWERQMAHYRKGRCEGIWCTEEQQTWAH